MMIAASPSASPTLAKGSKENQTQLKGFATCLILIVGWETTSAAASFIRIPTLCGRSPSSNGLLKLSCIGRGMKVYSLCGSRLPHPGQ